MYDKNILIEILTSSDFKSVDTEGNVLPPSDEIFIKISKQMTEKGSCISPKHIYTILKNDRSGMLAIVLQAFRLTKKSETSSEDSINASLVQPNRKSAKVFRLIVSAQNWVKIKPENRVYGGRRYVKFKPGVWTPVIAEIIWDQTRLPCAFAFKTGKVAEGANAQCYAYFDGKCKECDASLIGKMFAKPRQRKDSIFECTLSGFNSEIIHKRKRQLKGYLREQVAGQLVDEKKDAVIWRTEEAKKLMEVGDAIPPILYNADVLRKAKQEEADKRLNLICSDAFQNLYHAQYNEYANDIHSLSIGPFHCMYWSKEQLELFKIEQRDPNSYFLIDASGGFAKKLILPNESLSPHLFLYQCVLVTSERSIPIFQMISASQDAAMISYFLMRILTAGAPIPKVVVSDFGRAILAAVSRQFAECSSLKSYLQTCYNLAVSHTTTSVPPCYLRLDVSHLIAMVARWDCLRHKPTKVRQFYIRCIAQAYKTQSLTELSQLLLSIMVVSLSEEIGRTENGGLVPSETYLRYANDVIKGTVVDDQIVDEDEVMVSENDELCDSWLDWGNSILQKAKDIASLSKNGDVLSAFYNPAIVEKLKTLIANLPLWTGMMRQYFANSTEIATSSAVEALFSDYKNRAFKGELPMRVDKFIIRHIEYLKGKLLLACAGKNINIESNNSYPPSDGTSHSVAVQQITDVVTASPDITNDISCPGMSSSYVDKDEHEDSNIEDFPKDEVNGNSTSIEDPVSTLSSTTNHPSMISVDSVAEGNSRIVTNETSSQSVCTNIKEVPENSNELNYKENWHGLEEKGATKRRRNNLKSTIPKRKKSNYLDHCSDWDFVQSVAKVGVPLLKNGNSCPPVPFAGKQLAVRNTCAFDSIVYIVAHIVAMHSTDKFYTSDSNPTIEFAKSLLSSGKITVKDYSTRAIILNETGLFRIATYTRKYDKLNALCNAAHLAERLFTILPSLVRLKKCNPCDSNVVRNFATLNINVDIVLREGFGLIQAAIDDVMLPGRVKCENCDNSLDVTYEYGSHMIIDTSVVTDENYKKNVGLSYNRSTLNEIAKNINVNDNLYVIKGVVDYVGGHYNGIVFTGLNWVLYDDSFPRKYQVPSDYQVSPHILLYARTETQKKNE